MTNLKKKLLTATSFLAVATVAVGGTLAYNALTHDDESAVNVYTVGEAVDIAINEYQRNEDKTALEAFEQGKKLYPIVGSAQGEKDDFGMPKAENYGDKIVTIENTGSAPAMIRVFVAKPLALSDLAKDGDANTSDDPLHLNLGNRVNLEGDYDPAYGDAWKTNWGWDYNVDIFNATIDGVDYEVCTYISQNPLAVGAESTAVIAGVYLDSSIDYDDGVWTMGDYVINYDLSEGVNIPVYAEAVAEGTDFEDAATVFQQWADSVTGGVVAAPEAGAVRPAGYAPDTAGEEINNLVVIDESDDTTNLRALYKNGLTGSVSVSNSYLDGTYAMNLTVADGTTDALLTVNDTALKGWTSYSGFASASFTNCTFDQNTNPEIYKTIRPYDTTVFTDCDFAEGYEFWLDKLADGETITLVNCTVGGVEITDAAQLNIVYGEATSVVIG